jgi:hypothetical protein
MCIYCTYCVRGHIANFAGAFLRHCTRRAPICASSYDTHRSRYTYSIYTHIPTDIILLLCSCKSLINTGSSPPATAVSDNHNKHKNTGILLFIYFFELMNKHPRTSSILLHIIRRSSLVAYNLMYTLDIV